MHVGRDLQRFTDVLKRILLGEDVAFCEDSFAKCERLTDGAGAAGSA